MFKKSMAQSAYDIMSKQNYNKEKSQGIAFDQLYNEVASDLGMNTEEKIKNIAKLYTQMTLDGRFITLGENKWDLKSRYKFEEGQIDMNDIYQEEEEEEVSEEDDAESPVKNRVAQDDEEEYVEKPKHAGDLAGFHITTDDEEII